MDNLLPGRVSIGSLLKITLLFWIAITEVVGGSFLAQYFAREAAPLRDNYGKTNEESNNWYYVWYIWKIPTQTSSSCLLQLPLPWRHTFLLPSQALSGSNFPEWLDPQESPKKDMKLLNTWANLPSIFSSFPLQELS